MLIYIVDFSFVQLGLAISIIFIYMVPGFQRILLGGWAIVVPANFYR